MRKLFEFINPKLKAGRVPWGRIAIVAQIVGAAIFIGYTMAKKEIKLPFSPASYKVQVIFPDAKGLDPKDGPSAAVAGSPLGKVTQVTYENGRAVATLELDPDVKGKIFADATAALRPASALQNLLVNVDPGTPQAGPLPDGQPIQPQNTSAFVSIDELTSIFDADTQASTQILLGEAQRALRGRAPQLRASLAQLGDLVDTSTPVARALARRRQLLTQLVGNLDTVFTTVSKRGAQLGDAVDAGSRTLAVTSGRTQELQSAVRDLGPLVGEADRSLASTRRLTQPLADALRRLAPATNHLPDAASNLRALIPPAGTALDRLGELAANGRQPLELLASGTNGLAQRATDLIPTAKDLTYRAGLMNKYKGGVGQFADGLGGALSVSDAAGIYGQIDVLGIEPFRPENFGFTAAQSRSPAQRSHIADQLATALELMCSQGTKDSKPNPLACAMRFEIPGLPRQPLTTGGEG